MLEKNNSLNQKRLYFSILYWTVGFVIIVWSCYAEQKYGSEGALGALWLMIFLALPISYPFSAIMFEVMNMYLPNSGATFAPLLLILTVGYFQWFWLFPWIIRSFKSYWLKKKI